MQLFVTKEKYYPLSEEQEKKDDAFAVTAVIWNLMQVLKHQVRKETF